ncbi:MAG: Amuc_1100 family pilus-like protein [Kiritimatiellae bacterium]|nr:Amuc_1100 family pilus-like protein [Kiritimatiellia bacterium]
MSSKNTPVIVGASIVGVLAIGLAYMVFASYQAYDEAGEAIVSSNAQLHKLQVRPVFPSRQNAKTMQTQVKDFKDYLVDLTQELGKGQPSDGDITRDRFLTEYNETLYTLYGGRKRGIVIAPPAGTSVQKLFGFGLYETGTPPSENDLPRVICQMQDIKAICLALYDAGIAEMIGVTRTEFETAAALASSTSEEDSRRSSRRRNRGGDDEVAQATPGALYKDPDGLFTRESYTFSFKASDAALQKVLDKLAQGQPFAVVTALEVVNAARPSILSPQGTEEEPAGEANGLGAPAMGGAPAPFAAASAGGFRAVGSPTAPVAQKEAPAILPRDLRVSAGRELPVISMKVDVYRFLDLASAEDQQEPTP